MPLVVDRRQWIVLAGTAALSLAAKPGSGKEDEVEVPAVEDLMREHGVLRRALLVYAEAASRISAGQKDVPLESLGQTAALFRSFGEDYHERSLEQQHVFPPLAQTGGANASLVATLTAQHERGRELTDYVSAAAKTGRFPAADALRLFVRMYEHHAAIEDTVVFPAWKRAISARQYRELTEQFEDLEHRMFGKDGYEDALKRISAIEEAFGLADLSKLTAPPPP